MTPRVAGTTVPGGGRAALLLFAFIIVLTCCDDAVTGQGAPEALVSTASPQRITIITAPDILADYRTFTENRDVLRITHFAGAGARRDVVEVVLIRQALWEGGMTNEVAFVTAGTYLRIIEEITSGMVTMSGNSMWLSDLFFNDRVAPWKQLNCGQY